MHQWRVLPHERTRSAIRVPAAASLPLQKREVPPGEQRPDQPTKLSAKTKTIRLGPKRFYMENDFSVKWEFSVLGRRIEMWFSFVLDMQGSLILVLLNWSCRK